MTVYSKVYLSKIYRFTVRLSIFFSDIKQLGVQSLLQWPWFRIRLRSCLNCEFWTLLPAHRTYDPEGTFKPANNCHILVAKYIRLTTGISFHYYIYSFYQLGALNIQYSIDNVQLLEDGEITPYSFFATNFTQLTSKD